MINFVEIEEFQRLASDNPQMKCDFQRNMNYILYQICIACIKYFKHAIVTLHCEITQHFSCWRINEIEILSAMREYRLCSRFPIV